MKIFLDIVVLLTDTYTYSFVTLDYYRIAGEGRGRGLNLIHFLPVSPVSPIYFLVADL